MSDILAGEDEGGSGTEMWELVKLLNRELKATKSSLEVTQLESRHRLQQIEELQGRSPSLTTSDHVIFGSARAIIDCTSDDCTSDTCNSAREVKNLLAQRSALEGELNHCRAEIREKTALIDSLRKEIVDAREKHKKVAEGISNLQQVYAETTLAVQGKVTDPLLNPRAQETVHHSQPFDFQRPPPSPDPFDVDLTKGGGERPVSRDPSPVVLDGVSGSAYVPAALKSWLESVAAPDTSDRPDSEPCLAPGRKDPTVGIPSAVLEENNSPGPLFCSNRMLWCSEPYQHALFVAPRFLYDPTSEVKWIENAAFLDLVGKIRDVFYSAHEEGTPEIHYAGTYSCRRAENLTMDEYQQLSPTLRRCLRKLTLVPNCAHEVKDSKFVANCYDSGSKQVVCLALECVGFNQGLYQSLVQRRKGRFAHKDHSKGGKTQKRECLKGATARSNKKRRVM